MGRVGHAAAGANSLRRLVRARCERGSPEKTRNCKLVVFPWCGITLGAWVRLNVRLHDKKTPEKNSPKHGAKALVHAISREEMN